MIQAWPAKLDTGLTTVAHPKAELGKKGGSADAGNDKGSKTPP